MNLRLSIFLVAVLLIVVGTFLGLRFTGSEDAPPSNPWLFRIDENSIAHIAVSHQGRTVEYARTPGTEDWNILGEPIIPVYWPKFSGIPLLFSGPRVSRVLASEVNNPASYGLSPPKTKAKVTDRSGNALEFYLGDPTPDAEYHYARLVGDPALFTLPLGWAEVINGLADDPPYLRLFQLDDRDLIYFEVSSDGQSATYEKDVGTGQWRILGETQVLVHPEKWGEAPVLIGGPRVDQMIVDTFDDPQQYGLDPPQAKVRIIRPDFQIVEFHLGDATEDGKYLYARVSGQPELFAMPKVRAQQIIELATQPPYPPEPKSESGAPGSG